MKKVILGVAALVLGLAITGEASANGYRGHRPYYASHGVKYRGGYYYSGYNHNHWGYTTWIAGGGVKGGQAYGATDEFGFKAAEKPVHVHDLQATILRLMGFDHEKLTYRYAGRDFRLTDVYGSVVEDLLA